MRDRARPAGERNDTDVPPRARPGIARVTHPGTHTNESTLTSIHPTLPFTTTGSPRRSGQVQQQAHGEEQKVCDPRVRRRPLRGRRSRAHHPCLPRRGAEGETIIHPHPILRVSLSSSSSEALTSNLPSLRLSSTDREEGSQDAGWQEVRGFLRSILSGGLRW